MEVGQGQNWGCSAKGKKDKYMHCTFTSLANYMSGECSSLTSDTPRDHHNWTSIGQTSFMLLFSFSKLSNVSVGISCIHCVVYI
jgi:hypothetical protein